MRAALHLLLPALLLPSCTGSGPEPTAPASGAPVRRALFVVAPEGFRDEELQVPWDLLRAKGIRVELASSRKGPCKGMLGAEVEATLALGDAKAAGLDALVFVGGLGSEAFFQDPAAHKLAREVLDRGGIVAAICFAPRILAEAGLAKGKRISVSNGQADACAAAGALVQEAPVTVDGKLLTGEGPEAAREFADRLLALLAP